MNLVSNAYVSTSALYTCDPYLAHHGIKGQKWGIRRFQNEDGTLTSAGRKRYGEDLDISDLSRRNIARIRKGEAYRRLDVAKRNNSTNDSRIAELQGRVRSAKKAERLAKRADKGARLAAKGQTITGNTARESLAWGAAALGSYALTKHLSRRMDTLEALGVATPQHARVAAILSLAGPAAMSALAYGYTVKKEVDNQNLRAYQTAGRSGQFTKKYIGSTEYEDVVRRRTNKK